jgi:hypothetical protein
MSKIHSQVDKETIIGIFIFFGMFLAFIVNVFIVTSSLMSVYGVTKTSISPSAIDDAVLSQAVRIIKNEQ